VGAGEWITETGEEAQHNRALIRSGNVTTTYSQHQTKGRARPARQIYQVGLSEGWGGGDPGGAREEVPGPDREQEGLRRGLAVRMGEPGHAEHRAGARRSGPCAPKQPSPTCRGDPSPRRHAPAAYCRTPPPAHPHRTPVSTEPRAPTPRAFSTRGAPTRRWMGMRVRVLCGVFRGGRASRGDGEELIRPSVVRMSVPVSSIS